MKILNKFQWQCNFFENRKIFQKSPEKKMVSQNFLETLPENQQLLVKKYDLMAANLIKQTPNLKKSIFEYMNLFLNNEKKKDDKKKKRRIIIPDGYHILVQNSTKKIDDIIS